MRESLFSLSLVTTTAVKNVCVLLLKNSMTNEEILEGLSTYLTRDIRIKNTLFRGNLNNEKLYDITDGEGKRVTFTVTQEMYEMLYSLAYAFGCSVSKISAVLMYESITDIDFIESHIEGYIDSLNTSRQKELRQLLRYINHEADKTFSLADLFVYLIEEPIRWIFPDK